MDYRTLFACTAALLVPAAGTAQNGLPVLPAAECASRPTTLVQPFAEVFVNATCVDLTSYITTVVPGVRWTLATPTLTIGVSQVSMTAAFLVDPAAGVLQVDFDTFSQNGDAAPTTYSFLLGEPTPLTYLSGAVNYGTIGLVGGPGGGAHVQPSAVFASYSSVYLGVGRGRTNAGADLGSAPCFVGAATAVRCDLGYTVSTAAPILANHTDGLLTYTQTGLGSMVSFSNAPPSTTAPEPSTLTLVGGGGALAGAAAVRRRRTPA